MPEVLVLSGFEHGGSRRKGSTFQVSDSVAADLARAGLVRVLVEEKADPKPATGAKRSASPVAPASQKKTAGRSKSGVKRQTAESL